ncbi:DUF4270 domain-containing protein [Gilvimarinus agarilyticus]|nr:DUF4270 domain-containing protein [Gilvimarinus agarilyticus]
MNLLDKNWSGLLIFATLTIFSCEDPSEVGLGLDPDGIETGVYYEELLLPAQNVFIDSIRTSTGEQFRFLIGKITDDVFGSTSSTAYAQLSTVSSVQPLVFRLDTLSTDPIVVDTLWTKYVIDSAVLTLNYGDISSSEATVTSQTLSIHEVDDQLFSGVYYLADFETPILPAESAHGFSFTPRMDSLTLEDPSSDTVHFKLNQTWAERLFEIARQSDRAQLLREDFKGIAIVPDETNTAMIEYLSTGLTALNVHYHLEADTVYADSLLVNFSLSAANAKYNKITTDRTGSLIGNHIGDNLENFSTGDNKLYINPASGIHPKLSLQPLVDFLEADGNELIQLNNVVFELVSEGTETPLNNKVKNLRLYFIGDQSQININGLSAQNLYTTGVMTDIGYLTGSLLLLNLPIDTSAVKYRGAATLFAQSVNNGYIDLKPEEGESIRNSLVLLSTDPMSIDRSIIPQDSIKMKIFYSKPN